MPVAFDACGTTFGGNPLPGRDLGANPGPERLLTEVRAPGPRHDHGLDRVAARRDTELPEAVERNRADVALGQPVGREQVVAGGLELVDGVRQLEVDQPTRVAQALHVIGEAEHGRAFRRVVAADALEDARAVVEAVSADVNARIVPVDELAVHPDLLGGFHHCLLHFAVGQAYRL